MGMIKSAKKCFFMVVVLSVCLQKYTNPCNQVMKIALLIFEEIKTIRPVSNQSC
jgi:hypothetical protein